MTIRSIILLSLFIIGCSSVPKPHSYTSNPSLRTIMEIDSRDTLFRGTPIDDDGRFINLEIPFEPDFGDLLKWQLSSNPQKEEKKADIWRPHIFTSTDFLHDSRDCIVWLGHACFFIRLSGVTILTDPVFGDILFTTRTSPFPFSPDILRNIDYVFLSHDHRDHCDKESIQLLIRNNPQAKIIAGLGMNDLIDDWLEDTPHHKAEYAGWYQQFTTDTTKIKIYFMPARHWSKRGLFDTNSRLWGGLTIVSDATTIYISGDTGYGNHFRDAGKLFPSIDYAIMGVGAYSPRWFMAANHISPEQAIQGFHDMKAKHFIPMHYGTFDLSDEPISEPVRLLRQMEEQSVIHGTLHIPGIGEPVFLP